MAKKRDEFLKLINLCRDGKVDVIITKSISRFSRNVADTIKYVRELKALNVAVIFEKENIDTSKMTSEMILDMYGVFAQAESESITGVNFAVQRVWESYVYCTVTQRICCIAEC